MSLGLVITRYLKNWPLFMFVRFELFGSGVDGTLLHANSTAIYDLFVIGCVRFFLGSFTLKSTATMIEPYQI